MAPAPDTCLACATVRLSRHHPSPEALFLGKSCGHHLGSDQRLPPPTPWGRGSLSSPRDWQDPAVLGGGHGVTVAIGWSSIQRGAPSQEGGCPGLTHSQTLGCPGLQHVPVAGKQKADKLQLLEPHLPAACQDGLVES